MNKLRRGEEKMCQRFVDPVKDVVVDASERTVILLSGGLDSTILLYTIEPLFDVYPLSFNYGQKHIRELEYAKLTCKKLGLNYKELDIRALNEVAPSALTRKDIDVPKGYSFEDTIQQATVVPNRNMVMLSLAGAYAESVGAEIIFVAYHAGDRSVYPDCRREFIDSMNYSFRSAGLHVAVDAPFIYLTKKEIMNRGKVIGVPMEDTWSCYEDGETPCGKCGACVERDEK